MANFAQVPSLRIGRNHMWHLEGELIYESDLWPEAIVVPKGFETDLASIPRWFTPLVPVNGDHRASAIVHDYLVRLEGFHRPLADRIFLEAMKEAGVPGWRRYIMYWAVSVITLAKSIKR